MIELDAEDAALLERLSGREKLPNVEILRRALREVARRQLPQEDSGQDTQADQQRVA